jgi:hypothetical protein
MSLYSNCGPRFADSGHVSVQTREDVLHVSGAVLGWAELSWEGVGCEFVWISHVEI